MIVMAPIRLPCLMGSKCEFQTVELEYDLAKPQLDGHMQYAHGAAEKCTRPDLIRQLRQQLTSLDNTVKAIEAKESEKMARETVRLCEDSPAPEATTTSATPRTSSALISSREKQYPVWNKVCRKQRRRNKAIVDASNEDGTRLDSISLGEMAGLVYCLAKVSREVDRVNRVKVPHMHHGGGQQRQEVEHEAALLRGRGRDQADAQQGGLYPARDCQQQLPQCRQLPHNSLGLSCDRL